MNLDHLKSNWKQAGAGNRNQHELWAMTQIKNHPDIQRIRLKLIIETMAIIVFLMVYYDAFDGADRPFWANAILVVATSFYVIVRISGWLLLSNPIQGDNLKTSLILFKNKIKQIAVLILLSSFLFGAAVIGFFASSIDLTPGKYMVLVGMLMTLILLVYISSRIWLKRLAGVKKTLSEFNETNVNIG